MRKTPHGHQPRNGSQLSLFVVTRDVSQHMPLSFWQARASKHLIPHAIVKCDKQYSCNSFFPRSIQEVSAYICSRPSCLSVCSSVCLLVGVAWFEYRPSKPVEKLRHGMDVKPVRLSVRLSSCKILRFHFRYRFAGLLVIHYQHRKKHLTGDPASPEIPMLIP